MPGPMSGPIPAPPRPSPMDGASSPTSDCGAGRGWAPGTGKTGVPSLIIGGGRCGFDGCAARCPPPGKGGTGTTAIARGHRARIEQRPGQQCRHQNQTPRRGKLSALCGGAAWRGGVASASESTKQSDSKSELRIGVSLLRTAASGRGGIGPFVPACKRRNEELPIARSCKG